MKADNVTRRVGGFFPLVDLLERMLPGNHEVGAATSPEGEKIRFTVRKGFGFPPGDVTAISFDEDGTAEVEVALMGLIGPSGILPHWYHELVLERERAGDHAMGDFYDLFQHRIISIFYRAWKRSSLLPQKRSDHNDVFTSHLFSFLGLGTEGLREKLVASEAPLLQFCGQASRQVASASTVSQVLQMVFGVGVEVEPFVPRMMDVASADLTMLGQNNSRLGVDTVCGCQACDVQSTFRLTLGPMGYEDFLELSSARQLKHMVSLVRFLVGPEYEFEIRLVLKKEEVPGCRLAPATADAPTLGRCTWLKAPGTELDTDPYVAILPEELSKLTAV